MRSSPTWCSRHEGHVAAGCRAPRAQGCGRDVRRRPPGHREVIKGNDTVLTFDPHPLSVIRPEAAPKLLTPFPVKRDLIAGLGVKELVVILFDRDFASLSAEEFIKDVLIGRLGAGRVSVGENFRFGKGAKGTDELLRSHS